MKIRFFKSGNVEYKKSIENKNLHLEINFPDDNIKVKVIVEPVRKQQQHIYVKQETNSFQINVKVPKGKRIEFNIPKKKLVNTEIVYKSKDTFGVKSFDDKLNVLVHMLAYRTLILTITNTHFNMLVFYIYY